MTDSIGFGQSDDYIWLDTPEVDFYFGYEVTEDDEWCFEAKRKDGMKVTIKRSELENICKALENSYDELYGYLAVGMSVYYERIKVMGDISSDSE